MRGMVFQQIVSNVAGRVKRVTWNGRRYIVAPLSLIVPGVLPGSRGPLYYPPEEVEKHHRIWDGVPITRNHPTDPTTNAPISASEDGVLDRVGLGVVRNPSWHGGKARAEGWFDEELVKNRDAELHRRLDRGDVLELSTGLYTDNEDKPGVDPRTGRGYSGIARNYRADHLAVLTDAPGACSIRDGCGVNNQRLSAFDSSLIDVVNAFCPTGSGGGQDNSCSSKGEAAAKDAASKLKEAKDAIAKAKELKDAALEAREAVKERFSTLRDKAEEHANAADEQSETMSQHMGDVTWDSEHSEHHDVFGKLEELVSNAPDSRVQDDRTHREKMDHLEQIKQHIGRAMKIDVTGHKSADGTEWNKQDHKANGKNLTQMFRAAERMQEHMRGRHRARREMKQIRDAMTSNELATLSINELADDFSDVLNPLDDSILAVLNFLTNAAAIDLETLMLTTNCDGDKMCKACSAKAKKKGDVEEDVLTDSSTGPMDAAPAQPPNTSTPPPPSAPAQAPTPSAPPPTMGGGAGTIQPGRNTPNVNRFDRSIVAILNAAPDQTRCAVTGVYQHRGYKGKGSGKPQAAAKRGYASIEEGEDAKKDRDLTAVENQDFTIFDRSIAGLLN